MQISTKKTIPTTDPEEEDLDDEVLAAFELLSPPLLLPEDMGFGICCGGGGPCIGGIECTGI